jgi:hypothetical protein
MLPDGGETTDAEAIILQGEFHPIGERNGPVGRPLETFSLILQDSLKDALDADRDSWVISAR